VFEPHSVAVFSAIAGMSSWSTLLSIPSKLLRLDPRTLYDTSYSIISAILNTFAASAWRRFLLWPRRILPTAVFDLYFQQVPAVLYEFCKGIGSSASVARFNTLWESRASASTAIFSVLAGSPNAYATLLHWVLAFPLVVLHMLLAISMGVRASLPLAMIWQLYFLAEYYCNSEDFVSMESHFLSGITIYALTGAAIANLLQDNRALSRGATAQRQVINGLRERIANHSNTDEDMRLCRACVEVEADTTFVDCGHTLYCMLCAQKVVKTQTKCPICQKPSITQKLYFS
jgi:hypothetical protein